MIKLTIQLLHGRVELIVRVCIEETLDSPGGHSMSAKLVSLLKHLLDVILAQNKIYLEHYSKCIFNLHIAVAAGLEFSSSATIQQQWTVFVGPQLFHSFGIHS